MFQREKTRLRNFIIVLGYAEAIGMTCVLFHIFINAYLHDYKWLVYINRQGEAFPELIFFIIVFPFIFGGFFLFLKGLKDRKKIMEDLTDISNHGSFKDVVDVEFLEIKISSDGKTVWINNEEKCLFRAQKIKQIQINDERKK